MLLQTDVTQAMQLLPEVNGVFVLVQHESNVTPVAAVILQPGYAWITLAEDPDFAELLRVELRWMQISPAKPPVQSLRRSLDPSNQVIFICRNLRQL